MASFMLEAQLSAVKPAAVLILSNHGSRARRFAPIVSFRGSGGWPIAGRRAEGRGIPLGFATVSRPGHRTRGLPAHQAGLLEHDDRVLHRGIARNSGWMLFCCDRS